MVELILMRPGITSLILFHIYNNTLQFICWSVVFHHWLTDMKHLSQHQFTIITAPYRPCFENITWWRSNCDTVCNSHASVAAALLWSPVCDKLAITEYLVIVRYFSASAYSQSDGAAEGGARVQRRGSVPSGSRFLLLVRRLWCVWQDRRTAM